MDKVRRLLASERHALMNCRCPMCRRIAYRPSEQWAEPIVQRGDLESEFEFEFKSATRPGPLVHAIQRHFFQLSEAYAIRAEASITWHDTEIAIALRAICPHFHTRDLLRSYERTAPFADRGSYRAIKASKQTSRHSARQRRQERTRQRLG